MELRLEQPDWVEGYVASRPLPADDGGRLAEALALARENVLRGTGGPFAALVYDEVTGERLSCAVNAVLANHCALAHAETQALGLAQQAAGSHSLSARRCVLASSSEPCAMCLGALCWSGASRLLYATTRSDVEAIGFDEGPRQSRWRAELARRGIGVDGPRRRAEGREVLALYAARAGVIYNR